MKPNSSREGSTLHPATCNSSAVFAPLRAFQARNHVSDLPAIHGHTIGAVPVVLRSTVFYVNQRPYRTPRRNLRPTG